MLIDLSDILSLDGKTEVLETPVSMDFFETRLGKFPVVKKEPINLTITNTGKKVLKIQAEGKISIALPCDRCLKDVITEFSIQTEREVDMKAPEEDRIKDLDEINGPTEEELKTIEQELNKPKENKVINLSDYKRKR